MRAVTSLVAALSAALLTVSLLAVTSAPAEARRYHWETIAKLQGAKAQACRRVYNNRGSYYLLMRHQGERARRTARSIQRVYLASGTDVTRTRWVRPGDRTTSKKTGAYTSAANYRVRMVVRLKSGGQRRDSVRLKNLNRC